MGVHSSSDDTTNAERAQNGPGNSRQDDATLRETGWPNPPQELDDDDEPTDKRRAVSRSTQGIISSDDNDKTEQALGEVTEAVPPDLAMLEEPTITVPPNVAVSEEPTITVPPNVAISEEPTMIVPLSANGTFTATPAQDANAAQKLDYEHAITINATGTPFQQPSSGAYAFPYGPQAYAGSGPVPPPGGYQWQPALPKPEKQPGRWAQPLPLWGILAGIGVVLALLVVLQLTGSDWAAGAAHGAYAAFAIAGILLIVLFVRLRDGMSSRLNSTRGRQIATSVACIVALFVYSCACLIGQPTLHVAQGQSLENQQQWQAAIREYTLSGERPPDGAHLARAYASWGLYLNKIHYYNDALNKFDTVINQYHAVSDQVKLAQTGEITARVALGQQSMQAKNYADASNRFSAILALPYCDTTCQTQVDPLDVNARIAQGKQDLQAKNYSDATAHLDALLALSYCDSTCQTQGDALDATAYYNLAETNLHTKNYDLAVTDFDTVLNKFSSAPEAKQLHGDMAKSLMGQGQNTRASSCNDAIPIYQRLSKEYGDTPEGKQAQSDLSAPQDVSGHFSNIADTTISFTQMGLTQGLQGKMPQDQLFSKWNNASQVTNIQSNGDFVFHGVPQGDYDLIWYSNNGTYEYVEFMYDLTTLAPEYVAHVGPLCSVNMGTVSNLSLVA